MVKGLECKKCGSADIYTRWEEERSGMCVDSYLYRIHDDWPMADFIYHRCRNCDYAWWSWPLDHSGDK